MIMSCSIKNRPEVLYKQTKVALHSLESKVMGLLNDQSLTCLSSIGVSYIYGKKKDN